MDLQDLGAGDGCVLVEAVSGVCVWGGGGGRAWCTTGTDARRRLAGNVEGGCSMWAGELLVAMGALGYYSSNWSRPVLSECGQELLGQNRRDVRRVAHCRGQHVSGITKDAVGDIENGFHGHLEHPGDNSNGPVFLLWSGDGWSDMVNSMRSLELFPSTLPPAQTIETAGICSRASQPLLDRSAYTLYPLPTRIEKWRTRETGKL